MYVPIVLYLSLVFCSSWAPATTSIIIVKYYLGFIMVVSSIGSLFNQVQEQDINICNKENSMKTVKAEMQNRNVPSTGSICQLPCVL